MENHLNTHHKEEWTDLQSQIFARSIYDLQLPHQDGAQKQSPLEKIRRELPLDEALLLFKGGKANNQPSHIFVLLHEIENISIATSRAQ